MPPFFAEKSPLRTSAPLRKHMWATMDQHCVQLSLQFQFALKLFSTFGSVKEILILPKTCFALTFTTPRKASELKFLHCKERMAISLHLLLILREERIAD